MCWAWEARLKYGGSNMKKYLDGEYVEMTDEELAGAETSQPDISAEIYELKRKLAETDYKCLKFVDGALSEEEYAAVRQYRQSLRDEINALEAQAAGR